MAVKLKWMHLLEFLTILIGYNICPSTLHLMPFLLLMKLALECNTIQKTFFRIRVLKNQQQQCNFQVFCHHFLNILLSLYVIFTNELEKNYNPTITKANAKHPQGKKPLPTKKKFKNQQRIPAHKTGKALLADKTFVFSTIPIIINPSNLLQRTCLCDSNTPCQCIERCSWHSSCPTNTKHQLLGGRHVISPFSPFNRTSILHETILWLSNKSIKRAQEFSTGMLDSCSPSSSEGENYL